MASVTNIYARALADVVMQRGLKPAKIISELQALVDLTESSRELREVWETPSITSNQKRRLLDAIVERDRIAREVRNFVAVLIDHGRINLLAAIVKQFEQEMDSRLGFVEAEVSSARDLTTGEKTALESEVMKLTGKKVRAAYLRDPSLLGGARVKIGSTIYDGSVMQRLEKIRQQLVGA